MNGMDLSGNEAAMSFADTRFDGCCDSHNPMENAWRKSN